MSAIAWILFLFGATVLWGGLVLTFFIAWKNRDSNDF